MKERPKSMLAAKSFEPTSDLAVLARWLRILADELVNRMIDDEALYQRRPRNLCLHYRCAYRPAYDARCLCMGLQQGAVRRQRRTRNLWLRCRFACSSVPSALHLQQLP